MLEKTWHKLTIRTASRHSETVAARITDLTGLGTEIHDPSDYREPSTVTGYLASDDPDLADKLRAIHDFLEAMASLNLETTAPTLVCETIPEEDWDRKWREGFKAFHLTNHIVIKPSWENYQAKADEIVIELDPGQAFGTGLHASTRLIVELLAEVLPTVPTSLDRGLDVGTGTGILAISAALLGCRTITSIDIDPAAVTAARENIAANHLSDRITAETTSLNELAGPYNLIMANIIHNTLVEMAPTLSALLAPRGILLVAGILRGGQAENIRNRYFTQGLHCVSLKESGEWAALCLQKA
ncbi:MAG: 50S ribosomal protein L11 methyltransferase [Desulfobulbaceae bacterium]|nr:50S ribosomal protein L11 methyltransferase [Desulfobulbaceae bacterium]